MPISRSLTILTSLIASNKSPVKLRQTFERLGPTFVKLGQLISSRPDMFDHAYTTEFRKLLDHGPAIPFEVVTQIVQTNLGKGIQEIFSEIDPTPISSASIGQVHRAKLKKGPTVALKVRRPAIKEIINEDIQILKSLSNTLCLLPAFRNTQMDKVVEEFTYWIRNELDFRMEAHHTQKLSLDLKDLDYVEIPKIYEEYTSEEVLVSSFLNGLTLNQVIDQMELKGVTDPEKIKLPFKIDFDLAASRLIECYIFKQILENGFFQGDPHPANIFLLPQSKIGFVDFGIMGSIDQNEHKEALMLILSVVDNDPRTLLKAMTSMSEKTLTRKEELEMIDKLSTELHRIQGNDFEHATIGQLGLHISSLGRKYHLHWSPGVIDCLRSIALLEGAALRLVPHSSMVDLIKPHLRKYLAKQAIGKFSEKEMYKTFLSWMQLSEKMGSISDIIGDNGIKVENVNRDN